MFLIHIFVHCITHVSSPVGLFYYMCHEWRDKEKASCIKSKLFWVYSPFRDWFIDCIRIIMCIKFNYLEWLIISYICHTFSAIHYQFTRCFFINKQIRLKFSPISFPLMSKKILNNWKTENLSVNVKTCLFYI